MGFLQKIERAWITLGARPGALRAVESRARSIGRSVILCYHGVRRRSRHAFDPNGAMHVTPRSFEAHLDYLTRTCDVLTLDAVAARRTASAPNGRIAVAITFDDGYRDNLESALPLLRAYRCPATIFLPTGFIGTGRAFWWEELEGWIRESNAPVSYGGKRYNLATTAGKYGFFDRLRVALTRAGPELREKLLGHARAVLKPTQEVESSTLSWSQIDLLTTSGFISFGAHTVNHFAASSLGDTALDFEIGTAYRELRQRLAVPSGFFAFPYGRYADLDPRSAEALRRHGFAGAVTLVAGDVAAAASAYALPRIFVSSMDDVAHLRAKLAGVDAPFWLIRQMLDGRNRHRTAATV